MEKSAADAENTKPVTTGIRIPYVTEFTQVEWFELNPEHGYSKRFAFLLYELANRLPYCSISAQMVARVLERLPTAPNEKSLSYRRVKSSVSNARKHLKKIGKEERALIVTNMGYRASVDTADKIKNAIPVAAARADRANIAVAEMVHSADGKELPDTEEGRALKAKLKIYSAHVDVVEKKVMDTQRLLEAIKKSKL